METAASEDGAQQQIKVFLLDDHEVVRRGVRDMLEAEGDILVVGEAGTASSALARIPALRPDVAEEEVACATGGQGVEDVPARTPVGEDAGEPQERQVAAEGRPRHAEGFP